MGLFVRKSPKHILIIRHGLPLCKTRMADPTENSNMHNVVSTNLRKALEENTVAWRAMVSSSGAVEKHVLDLKAEFLSLEKLSQSLMQKALSVTYKKIREDARSTLGKSPHSCAYHFLKRIQAPRFLAGR